MLRQNSFTNFMAKGAITPILRDNCQVIFDGVDTDLVKKKPLKSQAMRKSLLMELENGPYEGFSQFIRGLPHLIKCDRNIRSKLLASMRHSPTKKIDDKSWGEWATNYLKKIILTIKSNDRTSERPTIC